MTKRNDVHILVKPQTKCELNQFKAVLEKGKPNRVTTDEAIKYLLHIAEEKELKKGAV